MNRYTFILIIVSFFIIFFTVILLCDNNITAKNAYLKNTYLLNGSEDHCLGKLGNNIIIATGFCDGNWNRLVKSYYFSRMISSNNRGFIKDIYAYNLQNDKISTIGKLPNYFIPRQEAGSIVIGKKYYIFGGYSYQELTDTELAHLKKNNIKLPHKKNVFTYSDSLVIEYKNMSN